MGKHRNHRTQRQHLSSHSRLVLQIYIFHFCAIYNIYICFTTYCWPSWILSMSLSINYCYPVRRQLGFIFGLYHTATICGEDCIGGLPDWEVLSSPDGPPQPIPQLGPNPDNTIKEPLTIATGLVNSFTNFVKDIHVHHRPQDSPAGDIRLEPVDNNQNICGQNDLNTPFEGGSDEDFQVCMYVCTYLLLCVLQHLSVCVCLTVCSPDVIFIHLVCP